MKEIRTESTINNTTNERLSNQAWISKKVLVSDLEILAIHHKTNTEQDINTKSETPSIDKEEHSNRHEPPISENRNTTTPNNTEQILTQEHKIDLENVNKIMNEQKTTLPSLKKHRIENNQDDDGKSKSFTKNNQ